MSNGEWLEWHEGNMEDVVTDKSLQLFDKVKDIAGDDPEWIVVEEKFTRRLMKVSE